MYQFIHYELYSLLPSKKRKSYISVAKEFMRLEYACSHVKNPLQPQVLYGVDAMQANKIIENRQSKARDKIGRKLRKDANVVLSGVCSLPPDIYVSDMENKTHVTSAWIERNIEYLKNKYEDNLLSVILHLDEGEPIHPHLHFVVAIPDTKEHGKANLMYLHEPLLARQTTEGGKRAKFDAYKNAYRKLQDEYHREVSEKFGLLRLGAKRQRLTRAEYNARKAEASRIRDSLDTIEHQKSVIKVKKDELIQQSKAIEKLKMRLKIKNKSLIKREDSIEIAIKDKFRNKSTVKFYSEKIERLKSKNRELRSIVHSYMKEQSEIRNSKIKYKMKLVEKEDEISSLNETILFKDELINKIRNAKTKIIIKGEFENEY
ncbi:plasmid recombination protein [Vibrio splendidus]|uniref:plasmid recombination protein n=1 Tax=Vibrio splendidus TaxID=29497 RepID=UPI000C83F7CC|nr:plasmid recombination protein [Vibrio splendidus]PMP45042.1 hypothetical protein BCS86_00795 [Vibrio splendidus]